tara:strand:- start:3643 stop:4491 length:849 start_codon:yes stop_codon:yes gene_type:complete
MKFCFFGYDHTFNVLQQLITDGHEALQVYTFKCDNYYSHNKDINAFCTQNNIPIKQGKITEDDVAALLDNGCQLFLSSGYPYKIPPIDEGKAYGVNIHPTLLPRARGIMPQPYILTEERDAAGFSIHKLTQDYDAGDILFQKAIPLDETTDIETLAARISLHTPAVVSDVINNIKEYWTNATAQDHDKASYYDEPDAVFRTLNWHDSVAVCIQKNRAFGRFGVFARVTDRYGESQNLAVFQFNGWTEKHDHRAGTLIRSLPREITVAVQDGYICLLDFSPIR